MPRVVNTSWPIKEEISRRFFLALERLVELNKVASLESFCNEYGLSAPKYRELRLGYGVTPKPDYKPRYKGIELEAAHYITACYPISAKWLLTGRGKMLTYEVQN